MLHLPDKTIDGVLHKRADGKRPHPAWYGCNDAALCRYIPEVHIAAHFACCGVAVDTHIHYHRSFRHHVGSNEPRLPYGCHYAGGVLASWQMAQDVLPQPEPYRA